jgi:hypothetical protein
MSTVICERRSGTRVQTVLRVSEGERYVGDILLDGEGRVWRHADTIPRDIVFKALVQRTRHDETCGKVKSRENGREYLWYLVGGLAGATASEE